MENEFELSSDDFLNQNVVEKFEEMLARKTSLFFDVSEFEDLIHYYSSKNETVKAIDAIQFALEQHPNSATLLVSCAQLFVSVHKPQEALKYLQLAESFEPFNTDLFYTKATIFSQLRKTDKAIDSYKKALEYASDLNEKEDVLLQLAFESENISAYEDSIYFLKEVLSLNPGNEIALYEIGFCFDISEKIEEGQAFFKSFVDINPYSHIAWFSLGITYEKLNLYEKAIDCYDFSIAIKDEFSSAYFNKAHCLNQQEKHIEALACYRETLQFDDEDDLTYYYIGDTLEKLEKYKLAIDSYKQAVNINEYNAEGWMGIASCYYEIDLFFEALNYINKALKLDNDNPDYWYLYGDIQAALGFLEEGQQAYENVLEKDENNETIYIDLGKISEELGEYDIAKNYYTTGIQLQTENGALLYHFIAFLLKRGDSISAYSYLDSALRKFYTSRNELFIAFPEAMNFPQVIELIEFHKK